MLCSTTIHVFSSSDHYSADQSKTTAFGQIKPAENVCPRLLPVVETSDGPKTRRLSERGPDISRGRFGKKHLKHPTNWTSIGIGERKSWSKK